MFIGIYLLLQIYWGTFKNKTFHFEGSQFLLYTKIMHIVPKIRELQYFMQLDANIRMGKIA